jgi:hypothetical protein
MRGSLWRVLGRFWALAGHDYNWRGLRLFLLALVYGLKGMLDAVPYEDAGVD